MTSSFRIVPTTHERVQWRQSSPELASFAKSFPRLVETWGLAHAVALAKAQGQREYLEDLAAVLRAMGHDEAASADRLERASLEHSVPDYVRLSCNTLQAAAYLNECASPDREPAESRG